MYISIFEKKEATFLFFFSFFFVFFSFEARSKKKQKKETNKTNKQHIPLKCVQLAAVGLLTSPEKRISFEVWSQMRKRKGRSAMKASGFLTADFNMRTAVAAAASVPSSLTSTKAGRKKE